MADEIILRMFAPLLSAALQVEDVEHIVFKGPQEKFKEVYQAFEASLPLLQLKYYELLYPNAFRDNLGCVWDGSLAVVISAGYSLPPLRVTPGHLA